MAKVIKVGILTASTKGARGERADTSYEAIVETLKSFQAFESEVIWYQVVTDDKEIIKRKLMELADVVKVDLALTTGGTGLSDRDVTPEATLEAIEKIVPGIPEVMRAESLKKTPAGMISRAVAGIRKKTLIVNLPGSPRGARECLTAIFPAIPHAIEVIRGEVGDHAAPVKD